MTGDLATGEGIEAAVDGIETIVHLAGSVKGRLRQRSSFTTTLEKEARK